MSGSDFRDGSNEGLRGVLLALWWDARGEWEQAHAVAQDVPGTPGAVVHAYLHRKEGDLGNAAYWYRQAGRAVQTGPLEAEWESLVQEFGQSSDS